MTTDDGFSSSDNITKINNPIIDMNSESGLSNEFIFLEISDGKGLLRNLILEVFLVFCLLVLKLRMKKNNSTYPITINGNLPDNNYGFFMMDASGNKSPEALQRICDSVDEYGFPTDESSHIEGYLLTVPNGSVGTYVREKLVQSPCY